MLQSTKNQEVLKILKKLRAQGAPKLTSENSPDIDLEMTESWKEETEDPEAGAPAMAAAKKSLKRRY